MLCKSIMDPEGVESKLGATDGLGLLPATTIFESHARKMTNQVRAMADLPFYTGEISGYEIHMGRTYFSDGKIKNAFSIFERSGEKIIDDGGGAVYGNVIGTYIHGIFDNDAFRRAFLDHVRVRKGLPSLRADETKSKTKSEDKNNSGIDWDAEYNKLADVVRSGVDMDKIYDIIFFSSSERYG